MESSGLGKSPNTALSFRYNANNEELEELFNLCEDDPPTPRCETSQSSVQNENTSPKKLDKTSSLIDKYFKSIRTEKSVDKLEDIKPIDHKVEESKSNLLKEVSSSPVKDYLNRLSKKNTLPDVPTDVKESNETWKIFHDFRFKIAQAVEDIKSRSTEETKEKIVARENSASDSEENSVMKDSDQLSVGDTDNQVSSLDSSIQNLSEATQPLTARATERDLSIMADKNSSESSDDTHKNLVSSESADGAKDLIDDGNVEVESGVEAFEDSNIENFGDSANIDMLDKTGKTAEDIKSSQPSTPTHFVYPLHKNHVQRPEPVQSRNNFFNLPMYIFTFLMLINYIFFPNSSVWNGFLLGLWFFCLVNNVKQWLLDNYFSSWENDKGAFFQVKRINHISPVYTIPSVKEHTPIKKYEGWINHYRYPDYDPYTYHVGKTTTAFIKLEGCNLRISYTRTKVPKRALWDEKIEKVSFYQHLLYNLSGARIILLPKGLVRKRQWSKKYPICIILNEEEKIQVLEKETVQSEKKAPEEKKNKDSQNQPEVESVETNTSPEKRKKFIWRRREKCDNEPGKEGLRHRFVRKMQRDKKTDSVSTLTDPVDEQKPLSEKQEITQCHDVDIDVTSSSNITKDELADEEIDDNDLVKLKEFLEETELETSTEGASEGEWSVHVRRSKNGNSHLYLFARTGRDKHQWYRRLNMAIREANPPSGDNSASEEKPEPDTLTESKDVIEMASYKVADKDSVNFAKCPNKSPDPASEGASVKRPYPLQSDMESYEKTFWPYLFKIIQQKTPPAECPCRTLPAEVTWVNTVVARLVYDVMRDPKIILRVQNRIQRKLHTMKLPSFMSPLTVTELSLGGACPLVERVCAPAWDERGVWLDAELRYDGGATITILTQINLMKLKEKNVTLEDQLFTTMENVVENDTSSSTSRLVISEKQLRKRKPAIFDSDVEDSAESSSEDESGPLQPDDYTEHPVAVDVTPSTPEGGSSKKKFLRIVDKIATNKYFQQVTDYKYIKRAMEGLSNTDIRLQLEIHRLEGRLAINMPAPPHDRIWLGFRKNPQLTLQARPAVGARALRFTHITNWIEQKLSREFEKVLVLPNMEDILLDVMTPTPIEFE